MSDARAKAIQYTENAIKILNTDAQNSVKQLIAATKIDPTYPEAYYQLGRIQGMVGALDAACVLFRKCLSLDPHHMPALVDLQFRAHWSGQLDLAEAMCAEAIEEDPLEYHSYINLSVTQSTQRKLDESLNSAKRALSLRNNHESQLAMSFALLYKRDFKNGLRYHEARYENQLKNFLNLPWPRLSGEEDLQNSSVVVISEQGIGDTLSFTRFLPALVAKAKLIHVMVHAELVRLYAAALMVYPNVRVLALHQPYPDADYWTSFMSLPLITNLSNDEILNCEDIFWPPFHNTIDFIRAEAKLNVGICWAGNKDCAIEPFRRVPVRNFSSLALIPGVQLYSLQVGECQPEIHSFGFSTFVVDCSPMIKDVTDSFAIMKRLDLIITSDTAVGHMAGALGKECWVLASRQGGDFRIGRDNGEVVWYKNHRAFHQDESNSWGPVLDAVRVALVEKVNA